MVCSRVARVLAVLLFFVNLASCRKLYVPVEWEYGWKTARVIATRYQDPGFMYYVTFTFPLNPNQCDRAELVSLIEAEGGWIFKMGGHPGAPVYVVFKGVMDRKSADLKLKALLPELSILIERLGTTSRWGQPETPKIREEGAEGETP